MAWMGNQNYEGKIKELPCPACGKKRPYDWFLANRDDDRCWKCRTFNIPALKGIPTLKREEVA